MKVCPDDQGFRWFALQDVADPASPRLLFSLAFHEDGRVLRKDPGQSPVEIRRALVPVEHRARSGRLKV